MSNPAGTQTTSSDVSFSRGEAITKAKTLRKLNPVVRILPWLSLLGLSACFGSTLTNLLVTSVKLTPANPSVAVSGTQQFILSVTFVDGTTDHEPPNHTTWTSDNSAVATIDKTGIATAVAPGTASIGGSFQGNNAHTVLTVTDLNPSIDVQGDSRTLHVTNRSTRQDLTFEADALSDSITISSAHGRVAAAEVSVFPERGPAWLAIHPSGNYLYVVNHTSESVSAFAIDWKTGALSSIASSPFRAGARPWSVEIDSDGASLSIAHFDDPNNSRFHIDATTGALTPER